MAVVPGFNVKLRSTVTAQQPPTNTGTAFVGGITQVGRTDQPVLVKSMQDYIDNFGNRVTYGALYDWLDTFFNEAGGGQAYVIRAVGPAATPDVLNLKDAVAANTWKVLGIGAGASGLSVQVVAGGQAGSVNLILTGAPNGETVQSPDLLTAQDAVNWANNQPLIRIQDLGLGTLPAIAAATPLAGGNDDRASITDVQRAAALALIGKGLGPGQVMWPGATTEAMYVALFNHAEANNRFALPDLVDTATEGTLTAACATLRADAGLTDTTTVQYGHMCADWNVIPGIARGTTRVSPPSARVAGLIARSDATTGNPNLAPAGGNGQCQYIIGRTQPEWTDDQVTALNAAGVGIARTIYGGVRHYAFRTLANAQAEPVWVMGTAARLRMAIINLGSIIGEGEVEAQLDGQGRELGRYNGKLLGMLGQFYTMGALYGTSPADAFVVDTGPDVNTPATIANREMHAAVAIRPSPFAEAVWLELAAYPANVPV